MTPQANIVWLDQPQCQDVKLVGGKAANLARLAGDHGIPPGFCLTTAAFARCDGAGLTPELCNALSAAYSELARRCGASDVAVAVRSSAVEEDCEAASFAGQHETFLNVTGAEDVAEAVVRCRASTRSDRASEYRRRQGLDPDSTQIAVLIQQLIPADVSAVVFSSDPVAGSRDELIINASWGLGESIVGGMVTPDAYRVRKSDLALASRTIAEKRRMTVLASRGTRQVDVPQILRSKPALDDRQAVEMARLALALEGKMGWPVDLECAYHRGRLYLLQCRPITTLRSPAPGLDGEAGFPIESPANFPVAWAHHDDARSNWISDRMHAPDPLPSLEFEWIALLYDGINYAAKIYDFPVRFQSGRINTYLYLRFDPVPAPPEELQQEARQGEEKMNAVLARLGDIWRTESLPEIQQHLAWWKAFDVSGAPMPRLLSHFDETISRMKRLSEIHFQIALPPYVAIVLFDQLYHDLFGEAGAFDAYRLLEGFDNKTLETNRALWSLSRKALASPAVREALEQSAPAAVPAVLERSLEGRAFLSELRAFLNQYGHRGDKWSFAGPRWVEDPTPVIQNLRDYLPQPNRDCDRELASLAAERARLVAEARARLRGHPQPVIDQFEFYLKAAQEGVVITEDHDFWIDFGCTYQIRRVILELARRLNEAGLLDRIDDVWHLTLAELRQAARYFPQFNPRQLIPERKAEIERWRTVQPPPELGTRPAAAPPDTPMNRVLLKFFGGQPPAQTEPDLLPGNPGSPGIARGPARVVRSVFDAVRLEKGDILVAEMTSPAWTPLFATVAAVVTDTGGILSHCAVVAREYRIPAVVGTGTATSLIHDGQLVEVDGNAGTVRVLSSVESAVAEEPSMDLFELSGLAAALAAAHQGALLRALPTGYATPAAYASQLSLDPVATERILEILASFGFADCKDGAYGASADFQGLDRMGGVEAVSALWSCVPGFLLRGQRFARMDGPPEAREASYAEVVSFLARLFEQAAQKLAAALPEPAAEILDVGAGSGVWSLAMAALHREARVVANDFPNVLQAFRKRAGQMGLLDRIDIIPGDFHSIEIPAGRFDRVILANVLHLEPPERARSLIRRMTAALAPRGDLVIVDMLGDGSLRRERARAVYGLHLALRTEQGRAHRLADLRQWVSQAGLLPSEVMWLDRSWRGLGAIVARRP